MKTKAVAYLRVSGKGQIKKGGFSRQLKNIKEFAVGSDYEVVSVYEEKGISGTTENRPAFKEMIGRLLNNGVKHIIIEGMDRLARELRVQENLCVYIASKDLQLISANTGENITKAIIENPMKKALIQIQGVFAELDKSDTVIKLRKGREAKRIENKKLGLKTKSGQGKVEGRKSYSEFNPDLVREIKRLRRKNPSTGKNLSFRKIARIIFETGKTDRLLNPNTISSILT